jgi:hypothetical protein
MLLGLFFLLSLFPVYVSVRELLITWGAGGNMAYRRWADVRGFALFRQPGYAVLALQPKQGKPVFLGMPPTVPLDELATFLRGRGLEQRFDDDARQPTLPAATS